jgi:hypothetical protein
VSIASTIVAPIRVTRLDVPVHRVAALTAEERYVYYLLGHFFNELMLLQKLLHFVIPKHGDDRPVRQVPEYGQLFFVSRIVVGKLWEAKIAIERPEFSKTLAASFTPLMPSGADRLKSWSERIAKAKWPVRLRNGHSFHYPTFRQWTNVTQPDSTWEDDRIFQAKESGNVFYAGSDAVASHWMFGQLDSADPRTAVDLMVDELISLLGEFTAAVEDVLGTFIVERLIGSEGIAEADEGTVETGLFEHVSIPFWTNMPARK